MLSCALLAAAWHSRTLATELSARLRRGRHAGSACAVGTGERHVPVSARHCTARAVRLCRSPVPVACAGRLCRSPVPRRPAREHLACLRYASRHGGPVPLRWNIDRAIQPRWREVDSNGEEGPAGRPLDRHPEHGPLPLRRTLVHHLLRVAAPPRAACRQRAKPIPAPPPRQRKRPRLLPRPSSLRSRGDRIRTCGLLLPKQALYQAELHPADALARDGSGRIHQEPPANKQPADSGKLRKPLREREIRT